MYAAQISPEPGTLRTALKTLSRMIRSGEDFYGAKARGTRLAFSGGAALSTRLTYKEGKKRDPERFSLVRTLRRLLRDRPRVEVLDKMSVWLLGLELPGDVGLVKRRMVGGGSSLTIEVTSTRQLGSGGEDGFGAHQLILPVLSFRPHSYAI
jgi:hypothetical protein